MIAAPDYVEPVRAWRTWVVVEDHARLTLRSVLFRKLWLPAEPAVAECLRELSLFQRLRSKAHAHTAPASACACGIYAATLETALAYLRMPAKRGRELVATAIGVVALWGDVVESDAGWRASRAYPERLFVRPLRTSAEPVREGLAPYAVPVDALHGWGGPDVVAALTPFDPLGRQSFQ